MASSPLSSRSGHTRARDERGVAYPSPVVALSVVAVAMAAVTFVATRDAEPTERRVDTATITSASPTESAVTETVVPTPEPPATPQLDRAKVYVEVYNNSGIKGLAATTAQQATQVGWAVVGEDNWYGNIPATTVYHPPRLKQAAKQLALDLGIERTATSVEPMRMDRLTIILTADAAG